MTSRAQMGLSVCGAVLPVVLMFGCGGEPRTGDGPTVSQRTAPARTGQAAVPPGHPSGLQRSHRPTIADQAGNGVPAGAPKWDLPEGWQSEKPASRMRQAQYRIPAAPGDAADGQCAVFYFGPGQGGGVAANIARWAAQFSEPDGRPATPIVGQSLIAGHQITRVEVRGTHTPSPMSMAGGATEPQDGYMLFGAILPGPDAPWFIKCTGPEKTMESQRARFDGMLASVRYGD